MLLSGRLQALSGEEKATESPTSTGATSTPLPEKTEGETGETAEVKGSEVAGEVEEEIWGEEEEEEEFTPVDVGCSWTLIGSLFFTMVMFYFVNYPDDDIKRYTWAIINTTLSTATCFSNFSKFGRCGPWPVMRFVSKLSQGLLVQYCSPYFDILLPCEFKHLCYPLLP